MRECLVIPTYRRNAHLWCALRRIREQDGNIPIFVFSDRGEDNHDLRQIMSYFDARLKVMPVHEYYGNSFCVMEALRFVYEQGYDLIHISEDDAMQHPDCLAWHREIHEDCENIFASCGWVFNQAAPITNDVMFAPWYYAPNACFKREKLAQIIKHANPIYYNGMSEYVLRTFPNSPLLRTNGKSVVDTKFFEQDAVIQFCLLEDKSQVAWCATAKIDHIGTFGYNRPDGMQLDGPLEEQMRRLETFIADPYRRIEHFGRGIVEREVGREIPKREIRYRLTLPGGWSSEFVSEVILDKLPRRINSVPLTEDAKLVLIS